MNIVDMPRRRVRDADDEACGVLILSLLFAAPTAAADPLTCDVSNYKAIRDAHCAKRTPVADRLATSHAPQSNVLPEKFQVGRKRALRLVKVRVGGHDGSDQNARDHQRPACRPRRRPQPFIARFPTYAIPRRAAQLIAGARCAQRPRWHRSCFAA
jgi:hypothetical protein